MSDSPAKSAGKGSPISAKRLTDLNTRLGLPPSRFRRDPSPDTRVLDGSWSYFSQCRGLYIHYGEFEELEDLSFSLELPAGLSFNLVSSGSVSFAIGGRQYVLGETFKPVECASFALMHADVLTRHMRKGQHVRKLNIFVDKHWFMERNGHILDPDRIDHLFAEHAKTRFWRPSKEILRVAKRFAETDKDNSLEQRLVRESLAIQMMSIVVGDLLRMPPATADKADNQEAQSRQQELEIKRYIDDHIQDRLSLVDLAATFSTSVSTLQRRFKAFSGMTVAEYIRIKKLERAKLAIIRDGLSIGEAAFMAGYNHPANFISAFTKQYAVSPAAYRQKHASS